MQARAHGQAEHRPAARPACWGGNRTLGPCPGAAASEAGAARQHAHPAVDVYVHVNPPRCPHRYRHRYRGRTTCTHDHTPRPPARLLAGRWVAEDRALRRSRRVAAPGLLLAGRCQCTKKQASASCRLAIGPTRSTMHVRVPIGWPRPMPGPPRPHNRWFCARGCAAAQGHRPRACRLKLNVLLDHALNVSISLFQVKCGPILDRREPHSHVPSSRLHHICTTPTTPHLPAHHPASHPASHPAPYGYPAPHSYCTTWTSFCTMPCTIPCTMPCTTPHHTRLHYVRPAECFPSGVH